MKKYETSGYLYIDDLKTILLKITPLRSKICGIFGVLITVGYFAFFGINYNSLESKIYSAGPMIMILVCAPIFYLIMLKRLKNKMIKQKNTDKLYIETYFTDEEIHLWYDQKDNIYSYNQFYKYIFIKNILFIVIRNRALAMPVFYKELSESDYDNLLRLLKEKGIRRGNSLI